MNGIMQGDIDEKKLVVHCRVFTEITNGCRRRIQSFAQEVEALQNMLDKVSDASRRRALEEDITGKVALLQCSLFHSLTLRMVQILLSCWNEIRSEVGQTLSKEGGLIYFLVF